MMLNMISSILRSTTIVTTPDRSPGAPAAAGPATRPTPITTANVPSMSRPT